MDKWSRPTWVNIDLGALKNNVKYLRGLREGNEFFCPMVKANAYGHGDVQICRVLEAEAVEAIGVALLEEGIRLRESGIKIPAILVFQPILGPSFLQQCLEYSLTPVLTQWRDFAFFEELDHIINVHLKLNTGMNRLGLPIGEWPKIVESIRAQKNIHLSGICTHLHTSEDILSEDSSAQKQLRQLVDIKNKIKDEKIYFHAMNSACMLGLSLMPKKLSKSLRMGSRPGLALYGIVPPMDSGSVNLFPLEPVLSWHTRIVQIQHVPKGEGVSYGERWRAKLDTSIAVLPVGYADGYRRNLSNKGQVIIGNKCLPIVGTVCMDYIMVELGSLASTCKIESEVLLLGKSKSFDLSAQHLADSIQSNAYEIVTCIGNRVPRIYI